MFEKSLKDLIQGIRNIKRDPSTYINKQMVSIKKELKSSDPYVKFVAVQKITYLHMIGFEVGFSEFHIVEVMSAPKFGYRRAGMLAANQIFNSDTSVILLCTNLLKKELHSSEPYETAVALNCLANIATKELARDLIDDVVTLLSHSRPLIRKKAILTLYKLYVQHPQGLPHSFERLRQRLDDSDMAVVSCTVNVICELSRKNPKNFLTLAPQLFGLMTTTSNNWMLIKVVKLMSSLVTEEPRLARKILDPLTSIVQTTHAKSLLYECIHAITVALPFSMKDDGTQSKAIPGVVALCVSKLREFVQDVDQNLKCLGLVGMVNLMQSHPETVAEHKEMIMQCLVDDDITVRLRALELLTGLITKRNLMGIVEKFLTFAHNAEGPYRDELINKIVFVCSRDKYAFLSNFEWYLSVLCELACIPGCPRGDLVCGQLIDVTLRVPSVRPHAANAMLDLLKDARIVSRSAGRFKNDGLPDVLFAAGWIVCEFAHLLPESSELPALLLDVILGDRLAEYPENVQATLIHNSLKIVAAIIRSGSLEQDSIFNITKQVSEKLDGFVRSEHIQVQERAITAQQLLLTWGLSTNCMGEHGADGIAALFAGDLVPVNPLAQSQVPVPSEMDLSIPIQVDLHAPLTCVSTRNKLSCVCFTKRIVKPSPVLKYSSDEEESENEQLIKQVQRRPSDIHKTPFYLGSEKEEEEEESIVVKLEPGSLETTSSTKRRVLRASDTHVQVFTDDAMPMGANTLKSDIKQQGDSGEVTLSTIEFDINATQTSSETTKTKTKSESTKKDKKEKKEKKVKKEKKSKKSSKEHHELLI